MKFLFSFLSAIYSRDVFSFILDVEEAKQAIEWGRMVLEQLKCIMLGYWINIWFNGGGAGTLSMIMLNIFGGLELEINPCFIVCCFLL